MKKFAVSFSFMLLIVFTAISCDLLGLRDNSNVSENNSYIEMFEVNFRNDYYAQATMPNSQCVPFGGKLVPVEPLNIWYTFHFVGWYRNSDYSGAAWNFENDIVTTNTTLYASWTDKCYVDWNTNGGIIRDSIDTYTVGYYKPGTAIIAPTLIEKTGYIFKGWDPTPLTVPADTRYVTYTAQWEAKKYTIILDKNTVEAGAVNGEIVLTYEQN